MPDPKPLNAGDTYGTLLDAQKAYDSELKRVKQVRSNVIPTAKKMVDQSVQGNIRPMDMKNSNPDYNYCNAYSNTCYNRAGATTIEDITFPLYYDDDGDKIGDRDRFIPAGSGHPQIAGNPAEQGVLSQEGFKRIPTSDLEPGDRIKKEIFTDKVSWQRDTEGGGPERWIPGHSAVYAGKGEDGIPDVYESGGGYRDYHKGNWNYSMDDTNGADYRGDLIRSRAYRYYGNTDKYKADLEEAKAAHDAALKVPMEKMTSLEITAIDNYNKLIKAPTEVPYQELEAQKKKFKTSKKFKKLNLKKYGGNTMNNLPQHGFGDFMNKIKSNKQIKGLQGMANQIPGMGMMNALRGKIQGAAQGLPEMAQNRAAQIGQMPPQGMQQGMQNIGQQMPQLGMSQYGGMPQYGFGDFLKGAGQKIQGTAQNIGGGMKDRFQQGLGNVKQGVQGMGQNIQQGVQGFQDGQGQGLGARVAGVQDGMQGFGQNAQQAAQGGFQMRTAAGIGGAQGAGLLEYGGNLPEHGFGDFVKNKFQGIQGGMQNMGNKLQGGIQNIGTGQNFQNLQGQVQNFGNPQPMAYGGRLNQHGFGDFLQGAKNKLQQGAQNLQGNVQNKMQGIQGQAQNMMGNVQDKFQGAQGQVQQGIQNIGSRQNMQNMQGMAQQGMQNLGTGQNMQNLQGQLGMSAYGGYPNYQMGGMMNNIPRQGQANPFDMNNGGGAMQAATQQSMFAPRSEFEFKQGGNSPSGNNLKNDQKVGPGGKGTMGEFNMSSPEVQAEWLKWAKTQKKKLPEANFGEALGNVEWDKVLKTTETIAKATPAVVGAVKSVKGSKKNKQEGSNGGNGEGPSQEEYNSVMAKLKQFEMENAMNSLAAAAAAPSASRSPVYGGSTYGGYNPQTASNYGMTYYKKGGPISSCGCGGPKGNCGCR
tara:strand:- start:342 stop:3086 length:2745 start_codon:yes stop_codon:yes gene_type:complete